MLGHIWSASICRAPLSKPLLPCATGMSQQVFSPILSLRQFFDGRGVRRQARQIGLRQTVLIPPLLNRRRPFAHRPSEAAEPNMVNCAFHDTHLGYSLHQEGKFTIDPECKPRAADLPGGSGHPYIVVLGSPRRGEPGRRFALWSIGYRAGTRRLAQRCAKVARWHQPSLQEKSDHSGAQQRGQYRMAGNRTRRQAS